MNRLLNPTFHLSLVILVYYVPLLVSHNVDVDIVTRHFVVCAVEL